MADHKNITAAFSGYRPEKMRLCRAAPEVCREPYPLIRETVAALYATGYRRFLSGMARGFDLWAARTVLRMRSEGFPELRLTAAVPFRGQQAGYGRAEATLYEEILDAADCVETLSAFYDRDCFRRRNDWMTDRASVLVCYYTGLGGGTRYTVERARRSGLKVINLAGPDAPGVLF